MNQRTQISPSRDLVDAVMESYVRWREKSAAVGATYRLWTHAGSPERTLAFREYLDALDREENAATEYRRLIEQAAAAHAPRR